MMDSETAYDFWNLFCSYIPAKDRLSAAARYMEFCDERGLDRQGFNELAEFDKIMEEAEYRYFKDEYESEGDFED
jgi:hypothetical protein